MKWFVVIVLLFPIAAFGRETRPNPEFERAVPVAAAQQAVVPITKLQFYGAYEVIKFGSGFCLDPECRFIVTNYHIAQAMGKHFSIEHERVVARWLASGPKDPGATEKGFNPLHDLAVLELRRSLAYKGFHGVPYNMEDAQGLVIGQDVDIYSFPVEHNPRRKLQHFQGRYIGMNQEGLLVFSYEPNPQAVHGGASGGLILDRKGRVMAVLADVGVTQTNMVLGVPVEVLSHFVSKIQPYLAARLFPKTTFIPPVEADRYPQWVPARPKGHLESRPVESPDIQLLRMKAQDVVHSMRFLISVESFEWGEGSAANDPQAIGYYEVRTFDGFQHFRKYPDGKKEMDEVPWPALNTAIDPADAWSYMPRLVSKEYDLRIRRAADIVWKGQTLRVFQYHGAAEDNVCAFDNQIDFGFMVHHHLESYDCSGEVWTDQNENIMRVSENYYMADSRTNMKLIVTFGWMDIDSDRLLVPITLSMDTDDGSRIDWCRGQFTDYQQARSTVRLLNARASK